MYDLNDWKWAKYKDRKGTIRKRKVFRIKCDSCELPQKYGIPRSKKNLCKTCQYQKMSENFSNQIVGICEVCEIPISRPPSQWKRAKHHTCSNKCLGLAKRKDITKVKRSRLKKKMLQAGVKSECVKCSHGNVWNLEAHHKVFVCHGGTNDLSNLEFQCRNCHGDTHHFHGKDSEECQR